MNKAVKSILIIALTVFWAGQVFAGGQQEGGESGNDRRELSAMVMQSRYFEGLQDMIAKLEEEENIVIDVQVVPDDQYLNLLKIKVNSGEATDLMDYNVPHIYDILAPEKYFADLSDEPWVDRLENPTLSTYDGKVYSYTFFSTRGFQAMIYNKEVFDELGLDTPTTVEEFDQVAETIKSAGITPILLASDAWVPQIWMTSGFSRALGSPEAVQDFSEKILTNEAEFTDYPELVAVVDNYLQAFEKGWINEDYLTLSIDGVYEKLGKGEGAMFYGGSALANNVESAFPEGEFGMFNMPVPYDERDVVSGIEFSTGFVVDKDSENLDLAKEVFRLWSTPEYANLYYKNQAGYPALEGVDGGEVPAYRQDLYDEYVVSGRMVSEMNRPLTPLGSLYGSTLWIYYQEAPGNENMDGYAVLERFQADVDKFMQEQQAPGW